MPPEDTHFYAAFLSIGQGGTFCFPTSPHCMNKFTILFGLVFQLVLVRVACTAETALWITGEPIIQDQMLYFRAEKPISNNSTGALVLLGAPRDNANLFPVLMKAAEKHLKLRLYGDLLPFTGVLPSDRQKRPSFQFIVWKLHMPGEPDELPKGQAIIIHPKDPIPSTLR